MPAAISFAALFNLLADPPSYPGSREISLGINWSGTGSSQEETACLWLPMLLRLIGPASYEELGTDTCCCKSG